MDNLRRRQGSALPCLMRWDNLFDDLESQLEQGMGAEERDLAAEAERLRLGRLSIRDRLTALASVNGRHSPWSVRLQLITGATISVRPVTFGRDWISGDLVDAAGISAQCIVPLGSIVAIRLTPGQVRDSLKEEAPVRPGITDRLSVAFVLRDLCRRRSSIELHTSFGSLRGTIDRVGRDHLDLAEHEPGSVRRETEVVQYRLVPFSAVALVRL